MNSMDEYCAPQWTDFTSSPQVPSEDFFEKEHKVHERQVHIKVAQPEISFEETADLIQEPHSISQTDIDTLQNIPVKVLSSKSRNNNTAGIVEQTITYNEVLCEAMKNLQLSAKRSKCLNLTVQPICQTTTPNFKTPTIPMVRGSQSMGVHRTIVDRSQSASSKKNTTKRSVFTPTTSKNVSYIMTPKCNEAKTVIKTTKEVTKEVPKEVPKEKMQLVVSEVVKAPISETEIRTELDLKSEVSSMESINAVDKSNIGIQGKVEPSIETAFSGAPIRAKLERRSLVQQRPRVLTCQYRRRSLAKYSRRSNQFVSLAEAVSKFQTGTPKRFRSTSQANSKLGPVGNLKQAALKRTIGISPVLKCKTRTRRVTALSQEERETLELEEIRKHPIKANPINMSVLKGEQALKKLPKKPITVPEPFNLTKVKKPCEPVEPKQQQIRKKPTLTITKASVPTVVSASDSGIVVAKEKVLFFGVPADSNAKNHTQAIPFSFESRNREIQTRKEQKLKQLQESKKTKAEFHARPVPKYLKPVVAAKEQNSKKPVVVTHPFSFEKRDRNLHERKEKLVQQVLEEDRKARIFHATPAPVFKPVMVKGRSKENLKAKLKETEVKKIVVPGPSKKIIREDRQSMQEGQENKEPNIIAVNDFNAKKTTQKEAKPRSAELNTDKRAKERRAFDEKLRQKEQEEEIRREKEEEGRLATERFQRAELRKLAEVKAKPMPVYKQLVPSKATKPLTVPQSPAWASKQKAKHAV